MWMGPPLRDPAGGSGRRESTKGHQPDHGGTAARTPGRWGVALRAPPAGREYREAVDPVQIALLLLPLVLVQLVLVVIALRNLLRPDLEVRGGSKAMWGAIIVFLGLIGPLLYFTVGRETE